MKSFGGSCNRFPTSRKVEQSGHSCQTDGGSSEKAGHTRLPKAAERNLVLRMATLWAFARNQHPPLTIFAHASSGGSMANGLQQVGRASASAVLGGRSAGRKADPLGGVVWKTAAPKPQTPQENVFYLVF
jgi:hypothetical protein